MSKKDLGEKALDLGAQAALALANDTPEQAAKALEELAYICSKGGVSGKNMFISLRAKAIKDAEEATSVIFIREKLITAEQKLRESRSGSIIIH